MDNRKQGTRLTGSTHSFPPAVDVARPDGSVDHVPLPSPYEGTCPICEGEDPKCDWADRGKWFADCMIAAGLRIEEGDMGETYEVERVFVDGRMVEGIVNRGRKREAEGQSALPRFNRYAIPAKARPGEVRCPYCVKRPIGAKGLRDHCRAVHPDKPEAR